MCGRTACTLAPDDVVRACTFRNRQGKTRRPVWKDPPGGQQYYPCYNVAPTAHTPVLLSSKHYPGELESFSERVVQPMKWGLVPPWHKGDPYKLEYETNNCRAEGMLTKRTYKTPLEKGKRCVILADGFFEWKRGPEGKQPYFIYFPQKSATSQPDSKPAKPDLKPSLQAQVKREPLDTKPDLREPDPTSVTCRVKQEPVDNEAGPQKRDHESPVSARIKQEPTDIKPDPDADLGMVKEEVKETDLTADTEDEEWQGKRLLTIAGVFDVWQPPDGSPPLYSYSVITVASSPVMAGIHHRMPAILSTEEEVSAWLDFAEVPLTQAVKVIHPIDTISMHMVSPVVNNSRNKSPECVQQYNPKVVKKTASSSLMMNWLKKKTSPSEDPFPEHSKKQRLE
ncbi:abasic site processing protein HMCES-like [Babylonia areolata]|uniref:abasic site processing protein HMCES-like n=1 Tax=Babylonia areolata TaxID=304850 RepID=UPI003FD5FE49